MTAKTSAEKLYKIVELHSQGVPSGEIANIIGVSRNTMWLMSKQLGITFHKGVKSPLSEEQISQIIELSKQKLPISKVASTLNIKYSLVKKAYARLGLEASDHNLSPVFTPEELQKVKDLFDQDLGARKIAEVLGCTRNRVKLVYEQLGLDVSDRKRPRKAYKKTHHTCKLCGDNKPIIEFRKRINGDRISYETICILCENELSNERLKKRAKRLRQEDPNFVIRTAISGAIWHYLKRSKSSKNGESCITYLPYTVNEIRSHLESLWEPWMNWDNQGVYNKKSWNDNDISTWTWQIDHIIPQSDLPYINMTDENFKICWSLNNLRPLSAKQNNLEGTKKIRHKST